MSRSHIAQDIRKVLNGLMKVANASVANQQVKCETIVKNSSVLKAAKDAPETIRQALPKDVNDLNNLVQRATMVPRGILQFAQIAPQYIRPGKEGTVEGGSENLASSSPYVDFSEETITIREEDLEGIYLQSLGVELMQQNEDGKRYMENLETDPVSTTSSNSNAFKVTEEPPRPIIDPEIASQIAQSAGKQTPVTGGGAVNKDIKSEPDILKQSLSTGTSTSSSTPRSVPSSQHQKAKEALKPLSKKKPTSQLSATSKQRKVPAGRISRLFTFGGLAAGLGIGTISEITKRSLGLSETKKGDSLLDSSTILTEANAERIVDTMCRVRGAALKIGQILSIQDNTMINPQLQKIFERVRSAADFMPYWQMEKMMEKELGSDWRSKLLEFDDKPFAAASIGQVHLGKLHDERPVAIKIQYPGVAQGIDSDIDNLMSVLNVWNAIPEGIFIDKIIEVAKRELSWEVDYVREAACAKRFRKLLEGHPDYYVPEVIDELSTKQIYTTELIEGIAVDKCEHLDQGTRDRISFLMLDLFFRELFEFQFMQTDPNWSNFLYNTETKQIGLLDFGASREYRNGFVDHYMRILQGAADNDKEVILKASRDIGFLTGYESKAMENAHLETVMILGEALRIGDEKYDFGSQDLTLKIQRLVPVMVKERLCPPPEEIYSLHRKLSGVFLLCSRLKGRVQCKPIFDRVRDNYIVGRPDK